MNAGTALALGIGLVSGGFALAWAWARKLGHYSMVDVVWAFGIGLTGLFWLVMCAEGSMKQCVIGGLLAAWSLRLGWHLQRRIRKIYPEEDPRYQKLCEVWAGRVASAFFWFFQAQAISVIVLALPFLAIAVDPDGSWSTWETVGLTVTLVGIFGEGLADFQMSKFKEANSDSKAVCRQGLWYYSRHPNYFFESIIWLGFYFYACGSDWGWATVHAPAVIIFLLLKVTGIPPTEAAAVLRKGDAYRSYQKTTSPFIPLPPRRIR